MSHITKMTAAMYKIKYIIIVFDFIMCACEHICLEMVVHI